MADLSVQRHEEKYLLNTAQAAYARNMLGALLKRDAYSARGAYFIRSLYFDTAADDDYLDKLLGVNERQKLRLRLYDVNTDTVKLELKAKRGNYSRKQSVSLPRAAAEVLLGGDAEPLLQIGTAAALRIYPYFKKENRLPAALIDYERTAFVLPVENVRITLDEHIRAAKSSDLFGKAVPMIPLHSAEYAVLEVKYDHYLPAYLRSALTGVGGLRLSISKYATAREVLY